jgi:hypothetical protein
VNLRRITGDNVDSLVQSVQDFVDANTR